MDRKLAAVLAADVAGYSALMEEDEERTHAAFLVCRSAAEAIITRHGGRVFGGAGDSIMAEFGSPVEALRAAIEFQQDLMTRPLDLPPGRRMAFRIGINLGDVMVDGDELYGDGVNIANRLQSLAEPGGIRISGNEYDYVKNKLRVSCVDLGKQQLKNIDEPVRVYRVLEGSIAPAGRRWRATGWRRAALGFATLALVVGAAVAAWQLHLRSSEQAKQSVSQQADAPPLPDQPSIAVLPFINLSGDPAQEYFSDGLTTDITTDLSKFAYLFVIAGNSAFTYKGKVAKAQEIGRDLGARYLLEGTVQKASGKLRINAQLIDATSGHHLWADRYEGAAPDLFVFQDEIIRAVVSSLAIKVSDAELRRVSQRETNDMSAYDLWLKGRATFFDPQKESKEGNDEARGYFEEAIKLDPNFSRAYGKLSYTYVRDWQNDWSDAPEQALSQALGLALKAVALGGGESDNHWNLAMVYSAMGQFDQAMAEYEAAKSLNPNDPNLLAEMGEHLIQDGRSAEAITQVNEAIKRNNKDTPYWYYWTLGRALYMTDRYDEAIATLKQINDPPYDIALVLAACYAQQGRMEEAHTELQKFRAVEPDWTLKDSARYFWRKDEDKQHWLKGLELAGLPRE
jgi:adenylate cyclase